MMNIFKPIKDETRYVCAIFIVKNIHPHDFVNYVNTLQPMISFEDGLTNIKKTFSIGDDGDLDLAETGFKLDLRCEIT